MDCFCQRSFFVHVAAFGSLSDSNGATPSWCPDWTHRRKSATDFWLESEYANDLGAFRVETGLGCMFDSDGRQLLIRQYGLEVASLVPLKKGSIMNASELSRAIRLLLPNGSNALHEMTIARLSKFLDLSEGSSADKVHIEIPDPRGKDISISAPSSFETFCDALFHVLHKYSIFTTEPYVTRKPDGVDQISCGIGLCYRRSVERNGLILMTEQGSGDAVPSGKPKLYSSLKPLVSAEEYGHLSELNQAQLEAMKHSGWFWQHEQAFVGHVAGCVCMAVVSIQHSSIGLIRRGIPQRDIIVV